VLAVEDSSLPFAEATFDVVVSSWALHNLYHPAERRQALHEIVRVLKPGGRLALLDIRHTGEYVRVLRESGLADVQRSGPRFLFVIPTYAVTATKPTGSQEERLTKRSQPLRPDPTSGAG
jgi:arsenite methyltransferase